MNQNWEDIKNLTVEEFTTPCLKEVSPETKVSIIEKIMQKKGIRHIPVKENNEIIGIISERDIFFAYRAEKYSQSLAKDIMQKKPYIVDSNIKLSEVAFYMSKNKYGSALVKDTNGELGIFTSIDALNALVEVLRGDLINVKNN